MTTTRDVPAPSRTLEYLSAALFGAVMGLTDLGIARHVAADRYGVPSWIGQVIGAAALLAFVAVSAGYLVKSIGAPDAVRAEFRHPIAETFSAPR